MVRWAGCAVIAVACTTEAVPEATETAIEGETGAQPVDSAPVDTDLPPATVRATCTLGPTCGAPVAPGTAAAAFRADVFYPYGPGAIAAAGDPVAAFGTPDAPTFPEAQLPDPASGGRVHVVLTATTGGSLVQDTPAPGVVQGGRGRAAFQVRIDGELATARLDAGTLDWLRVWPTTFEAGDPVWVAWHSREAATAPGAQVALQLPLEGGGTAFDGTVTLATSPVRITSVAHAEDRTFAWVHVHNDDAVPHTLSSVQVDGRDATDAACAAVPTVPAGGSVVLRVPTCAVPAVGDVWTVVLGWEEGVTPSAAGGRVLPAHFPTQAWPQSGECPFPGVNDAALQRHVDAGIDTLFQRGVYTAPGCGNQPTPPIVEAEFARLGLYAMPDEGTPLPATRTDRVAARLLGDEVDSIGLTRTIDEQRARQLAEETAWMNEETPEVPTYIGASRHRLTGLYAGVADIQGMDFYAAACAPHATEFGVHPPVWGPWAYLRATRDNHLPHPTWLYAQGLHGGWKAQPTALDVRHGALSVAAAGGKGLMWFQTELALADVHPEAWAALGAVSRDLRALGPWLRVGDLTETAEVLGGDAIAAAVRLPDAMLLVVLPTGVADGPEDLPCALGTYTPWRMAEGTIDVAVTLPDDLVADDTFELRDGVLGAPPGMVAVSDRRVRITGIPVAADSSGWLIVVAADPSVRAELAARLGG